MTRRWIYAFGDDVGDAAPKALLGGKGAGLAEMTRLGIPVPPGFTITTEACHAHRAAGGRMPEGLEDEIDAAIRALEERAGARFGDPGSPLLVSVRSGAPISMPGMMDTVLNLGLNDDTVEGLARASGDRRFAFDAYRRLLTMYGDVVLGVPHDRFEDALHDVKRALGDVKMADHAIDADHLEGLVRRYRALIEQADRRVPSSPREQLLGAIHAVFESWSNPRAKRYRAIHGIDESLGTAVNVQAMVFGNLGDDSGSGVLFTRDPATGEKGLYGEYLENAQGEDVVAGTRTPRAIRAAASAPGDEDRALERAAPEVYAAIERFAHQLEAHYRDVQDIEITVQRGEVFVLQTRTGKRTAQAAVKIAVDLVEEGVISEDEAVLRVDADQLDQLLHPRLPDPETLAVRGVRPLARGLPASPGAATGAIVLSADAAEARAKEGAAVILVRRETSPEDIHGMKAARGIVTATGGMTSHAAVVARGLGTCCVAGVSTMSVDYANETVTIRGDDGSTTTLAVGDEITLDGTHGAVYGGAVEASAAGALDELERLLGWADARRRLGVRANAETPEGAETARRFGAEGIGLCRTEHMFFAEDRLEAVRAMILADTAAARERWLREVQPKQREDFEQIFEAMDGYPVTIRLLDWPLHELLPHAAADYDRLAQVLGRSTDAVRARAESMREANPMLGHRGVRLGLTDPAIYRMQVRAIAEAALARRAAGGHVEAEIMIPVVALAEEVQAMRALVLEEIAKTVGDAPPLDVRVGTMIELPRACLVAGAIAEHADFFSFGTNDLTQTSFGISRDDAGTFIPRYRRDGILKADPFAHLDEDGVGALVRIAVERGRAARPALSLGVCGEHGGDPASIAFCHAIGLDYVSCSPPRLPAARLAAAQAALRARGQSASERAD